jgi:hypothetical protein
MTKKRCPAGQVRKGGKCLDRYKYNYAMHIFQFNPMRHGEIRYYRGEVMTRDPPHGIDRKIWKQAYKDAKKKGWVTFDYGVDEENEKRLYGW